jgi:hypothetical protein
MIGRGYGYFGDYPDKLEEIAKKKEYESKFRVSNTQTKSNNDGIAMFNEVPVGIYSIVVEGNSDYQPAQKKISLQNENEGNIVRIYVGMKPRIDTDVEFMFLSMADGKE